MERIDMALRNHSSFILPSTFTLVIFLHSAESNTCKTVCNSVEYPVHPPLGLDPSANSHQQAEPDGGEIVQQLDRHGCGSIVFNLREHRNDHIVSSHPPQHIAVLIALTGQVGFKLKCVTLVGRQLCASGNKYAVFERTRSEYMILEVPETYIAAFNSEAVL